MIRYELSAINIHQIQIFLSVAETASFTKSAQIFNMTQPGVSKGISKLEEFLGFPLFIRTNRLITLTPAGKALYNDWHEILNGLEQGYLNARAIHHLPTDDLRLGIPFSINSNKALTPYLDAWNIQHPQCTIHVIEESIQALLHRSVSNKFHISIIPCAQEHILDSHTLSWRPMSYSNMQVILAKSHPLASSRQLSLSQLAPYPHIIYEPSPDAYNDEYLRNILSPLGITPRIEGCGKSNYEIHKLLVNTQRILLIDGHFRYDFTLSDCIQIPVCDCQSSLLCVWNTEIESAGVVSFLSLVDKLCPTNIDKV